MLRIPSRTAAHKCPFVGLLSLISIRPIQPPPIKANVGPFVRNRCHIFYADLFEMPSNNKRRFPGVGLALPLIHAAGQEQHPSFFYANANASKSAK